MVRLLFRERDVYQVLGNEPDLEFVGADHIADEQVVSALIAGFGGLASAATRFAQDDLVSFDETRNLSGDFFPFFGRTRNLCQFDDIGSGRNTDTAEQLDTLGKHVDDFVLFGSVLVEEFVKREKGRAGDLPMVFLVEVAQSDGVGEDLVENLDTAAAHVFIETDRHASDGAKSLQRVIGNCEDRRSLVVLGSGF